MQHTTLAQPIIGYTEMIQNKHKNDTELYQKNFGQSQNPMEYRKLQRK